MMRKKLFIAVIALMTLGAAAPAFAQTATPVPVETAVTGQSSASAAPTKDRKVKLDKKMRRIGNCDSACTVADSACGKRIVTRSKARAIKSRRGYCQSDTAVCPASDCRPCAPANCAPVNCTPANCAVQRTDSVCCRNSSAGCQQGRGYRPGGRHRHHHGASDCRQACPATPATAPAAAE